MKKTGATEFHRLEPLLLPQRDSRAPAASLPAQGGDVTTPAGPSQALIPEGLCDEGAVAAAANVPGVWWELAAAGLPRRRKALQRLWSLQFTFFKRRKWEERFGIQAWGL